MANDNRAYDIGTVSVENGSTTVTGVGVAWDDDAIMAGDEFWDPAQGLVPAIPIVSITSATQLELAAPWPGATMGNRPYWIKYIGIIERSTKQNRRYLELAGRITNTGIGIDGFGEFADREAYDDAGELFVYLSQDGDGGSIDYPVLFIKNSSDDGDWSAAIDITGPRGFRGWTPVLASVVDGGRRVQQLIGYVGGEGDEPTDHVGQYVSPTGYTATIGSATDLRGPTGADGTDPGILLTWDDGNADADPGAGNIRANNDALASATILYVSKTNRAGDAIAAFLARIDDSTSTPKGELVLTRTSGNAQAGFVVAGITDASGYVKIAVSGHWGTTGFIDGNAISFQFVAKGNKGNDGAGTVAGIVAGDGIDVDSTDPTAPVISVDIEPLLIDQAALALELAELAPGAVSPGPGIADGFNVLTYVDTAGATNLDTTEAGVLKPTLAATTVMGPLTFAVNQTAYTNFNHRWRIAASQISASGSMVRLQLTGVTTGTAATVTGMFLGHKAAAGDVYDFDGTQVQLRVGGSTSFDVPVGQTIYTDWIVYPLDETKDLIISCHTSGGDIRVPAVGATANFDWWTKVGASEVATTNVTGYTQSGSYDIGMVSAVQIAAGGANLTVASSSMALAEAPDWAFVAAIVTIDTAAINGTLVFSVTADGVDYKDLDMSLHHARPDGTQVYVSEKTSLSDVDPGTAAKWRIETSSAARPKVHAIEVRFGADA